MLSRQRLQLLARRLAIPSGLRRCRSSKDDRFEDIIEDLISNTPMWLEANRLDQEELSAVKSGVVHPAESTQHSAQLKTRKERSEHYFPKKEKAERAKTLDVLKMEKVIQSYMTRGHLAALIDPLYIVRRPMFRPEFPARTVLRQLRVPVDRDVIYLLPNNTSLGGGSYIMKLGKLIKMLNEAYCSTIGFEFTHLNDSVCRNWIRDRIETPDLRYINKERKEYCAKKLVEISELASFLEGATDYTQRYGISGSETSPLGIDLVVQRAAKKYGGRVFVIGIRRLARFAVMCALGMDQSDIFQLIRSTMSEMVEKHCLGTCFEIQSPSSGNVNLEFVVAASPAIPESFYPIVLGITKGIQDREGDKNGDKVWPIVVHQARGLNAQGITYETLKLNVLPNFNTHGTVHLVFNNQMEQTLKRGVSMKTEYCTDVFKAINAPIFHVNGDDIEAVYFVCRMAADYRATFRKDVVVDIVSYQRAMASRTQAKYELVTVQEKINQTPPRVPSYLQKLQEENVMTRGEVNIWKNQVNQRLSQQYHSVENVNTKVDMDRWSAQVYLHKVKERENTWKFDFDTGVKKDTLKDICAKLIKVPDDFKISSKQQETLKKRANLVENDTLDWVICEALAYGSLLLELKNVRITGMDVNRRLHVLYEDKSGGKEFNLLGNLSEFQGRYNLCKSTTSQYATAGFEYGYSTSALDTLVAWEAPEGDKTSKAQVVIDNFVAGGFDKYNYHSNIVLLLPHYLKCETSSRVCNGRPERFLQLVNNFESVTEVNVQKQMKETNMIIANVSTPANFFHILRRQMYLPYRRPLVIFTPNLISSHPDSKAKFDDLEVGTRFQAYFPDMKVNTLEVKKCIICTGKLYYDLIRERESRGLTNVVSISRIEQMSPLPYGEIIKDIKRYLYVEVSWVQEEPVNQGWFSYLEPRLLNLPNISHVQCVARPARADGGSRSVNSCFQEQKKIYEQAFTLP